MAILKATKVGYWLDHDMKKIYQGYIESQNFAQSRTFVAFKIAIEDWPVYRTRVNNRYKLNFFSKTA